MKYNQSTNRLLAIMRELRRECPWDRKQTIHTLRQQTLEEIYELTDTIDREDWDGMKEELGDLLLHLVFYSRIAEEQGHFQFGEVVAAVCDKLVKRHPHVYGSVKVGDDSDVKKNWEQIKLAEGKKSVLSGVPEALPAIMKALRLQEKTKQVGFEWDRPEQVLAQMHSELDELQEAISGGEAGEIEEELGDVLFSMVNYARFLDVDPERALERTNRKFIRRFTAMEVIAEAEGKQLHEMNLEEMDGLWNRVKKAEKESE